MGDFSPMHWLILGVILLGPIAVAATVISSLLGRRGRQVPREGRTSIRVPTAGRWSRGWHKLVRIAAGRFNPRSRHTPCAVRRSADLRITQETAHGACLLL